MPRIGWQIDPFGHSSVQAGAMGAAMGFDAMFFGRADFEDMKARKELRQLEFLWRGTGAGPTTCDMDGMIFTGNFASGNYGPPDGFNFESSVSDTPVQDDTRLRGFNVDERVDLFVKRCHELAAVTRGDDIMFTMGSDFHYSSAEAWFTNLDKLIGAVNARFSRDSANGHHHRRIEVFYSTPDQYVVSKARQAEASSGRVSYPVKVDDFFRTPMRQLHSGPGTFPVGRRASGTSGRQHLSSRLRDSLRRIMEDSSRGETLSAFGAPIPWRRRWL